MPRGQVATATAAFSLVRTLGGTIGLSVSGALLQSEVESRTASILGYTASSSSSSEGTGGTDIRNLHLIEPYDTRIAVLDAYSNGLKIVWLSGTAVAGGAFVVGLFVRGYGERKKRKRGRTEKPTSSASSASSPSSHQHSQSRPVGSQTLGGRGDQEEEGADLEMEMAALEKHPAKRGEVELLSPISKGGDVEKMQSPSPK